MNGERTPVYLERGGKKVFACSLEWPGWCRSGKTDEAALEALDSYAPRYAPVAAAAGLPFAGEFTFTVTETLPGSTTTDFGAPDAVPASDLLPLGAVEARRQVELLRASWEVFAEIVARTPQELRKGPRGGGRDRDKMHDHVLGAEAAYARTIGVRHRQPSLVDTEGIAALREDIAAVLGAPWNGDPLTGKGKSWPPRYAARRMAWHVLDHAWEMQDRTDPSG
jgi:hypothetical protein